MTKKILVTGGAGYIGSHTCVELVNAGFEPIIIDNFSNSERFMLDRIEQIAGTSVKCIEADCRDEDKLYNELKDMGEISGVIHFAAYKAVGESSKLPLKYYHNNIQSTVVVLSLMEKLNIPSLVFSSSCTVYGQPDQLPVTENSPTKPAESPYGRTKQICEDMLKDYNATGADAKIVALRYFNPIGAHPTSLIGELPIGVPNNLVPFITQTAAGLREKLTVFGNDYSTPDGSCIRDYIHVVDLAKAHVAALKYMETTENGSYTALNVGSGQGNSVLEVVKAFEEATNEKLNYEIGARRSGDVEQVYADATISNETLNWKVELSLKDALRDAWNWQVSLKKD